jgi:hypothetical protein
MRILILIILILLCASCKTSHNSCDAYGKLEKTENPS